MGRFFQGVVAWLRREPASVYVTGAGQVAALVVALAHLSPLQAGYLAGGVTAAGTIVTALLARPWHVAVIAGAAGVVIDDLAIFRWHISPDVKGIVVSLISLVLGHMAMRPNLTPRHS